MNDTQTKASDAPDTSRPALTDFICLECGALLPKAGYVGCKHGDRVLLQCKIFDARDRGIRLDKDFEHHDVVALFDFDRSAFLDGFVIHKAIYSGSDPKLTDWKGTAIIVLTRRLSDAVAFMTAFPEASEWPEPLKAIIKSRFGHAGTVIYDEDELKKRGFLCST